MALLVVGAGAVGGYFGGRLVEAGADVTFLIRPSRWLQLERYGLSVDSPLGDMRLRVKTVKASELQPGFDLVLLACKAYDLQSAIDDVAPAMDGRCALLPLLNGIAHLDRLDERFGRENVLGGTCALNVTLRRDGTIHHAINLQRLVVGERSPRSSARLDPLIAVLSRTSIQWEVSANIHQDMWEKVMVLSALAALTCLFRANVGEIMRAPGGPAAIERALAANIEIASREGYPPRAAAVEFARKMLLDPASGLTASMLRDLDAGARVEADHIVGWMLERARKQSLDDTILSLAYAQLKCYEGRRDAFACEQAQNVDQIWGRTGVEALPGLK